MDIDQLRLEIIRRVIGIEGGYVNNPRDSGGATRWGITSATARSYGLDVRQLTPEQATDIYLRGYWSEMNLDGVASLSPLIAEELFDSGVNLGPTRAGQWLQRCLNVLNQHGHLWPDITVDGDIGAGTLGAIDAFFRARGARAEPVLMNMLNALQSEFYIELAERRPKDEEFQQGWQQNRVGTVRTDSPEQMMGLDAPALEPYRPPMESTTPQLAPVPTRSFSILDWLPGIKTHLVVVATVAMSTAELLGYSIPAPVYSILAAMGVSTAYAGLTRPLRGR